MRAGGRERPARPRVLLIDNRDSFTWNLVHALGVLGVDVVVCRNDAVDVPALRGVPPDALVISPGPCGPEAAGMSADVVRALAGRVPILGVCLGHQVIGAVFGATLRRVPLPLHGRTSTVHHDGRGVFATVPEPFRAMRYHSLTLDRSTLPRALEVAAWTADGTVMAVRHRDLPIVGLQFHPESVLTPAGPALLAGFLVGVRACGRAVHAAA